MGLQFIEMHSACFVAILRIFNTRHFLALLSLKILKYPFLIMCVSSFKVFFKFYRKSHCHSLTVIRNTAGNRIYEKHF